MTFLTTTEIHRRFIDPTEYLIITHVSVDTVLSPGSGVERVFVDTSSSPVTITLPAVTPRYYPLIVNAGNNPVTILPNGTDTIGNEPSQLLVTRYSAVNLLPDTTNWIIRDRLTL